MEIILALLGFLLLVPVSVAVTFIVASAYLSAKCIAQNLPEVNVKIGFAEVEPAYEYWESTREDSRSSKERG